MVLIHGQDMNRYSSSQLKVEFEGPDVNVEELWELLRVRASLYFAL